MSYRSYDFERIYNEFRNCFTDVNEADQLYYDWLKVMGLDETREYAQARESYLWKKDDLQFVKEDAINKYYEVEVGFPTKSMNGNVYKKRDLVAASLTLKGKHPSMNHKDEFWFSPKNPMNRWGNISIVDGRFHEGVSKALIAVPKDMICPICNGKKMTELIDNHKIVNVSLEGDCASGRCPTTGECEGFYYTDPPFTLLTTDILPGIPMTRIKPLESYIPSQSSIYRGKNKLQENEKTVKIKPTITETPVDKTEPKKTIDTTSVKQYPDSDTFRGTWGTTLTSDKQIYDGDKHHNAVTVSGPNPTHAFVSGNPMSDVSPATPRTAEARRREAEAPDYAGHQGPYAPTDGPAGATAQPKPEDITTGPSRNKPADDSELEFPDGAPTSFPSIEKPETKTGEEPPKADDKVVTGNTPSVEQAGCEDGFHKDPEGNCVPDAPTEQEGCADGYHKDEAGNCVPDEDIEERVKRWKAEDKARSYEEQSLNWEKRYVSTNRQLEQLKGRYEELKTQISQASARKENAIRDMHNAVVDKERYKRLRDEAAGERDEAKLNYEKLARSYNVLDSKYNESMQTNLSLSKKVTIANEDYLEKAREAENLKEALGKAKVFSKKTLKLKV